MDLTTQIGFCVKMNCILSPQVDCKFSEGHILSFFGNSTVLCTVLAIKTAVKNMSDEKKKIVLNSEIHMVHFSQCPTVN